MYLSYLVSVSYHPQFFHQIVICISLLLMNSVMDYKKRVFYSMLFCLNVFVVAEFPSVPSYYKCRAETLIFFDVCWSHLSS